MTKYNQPQDDAIISLLQTDSEKAMQLMFREYYPLLVKTIFRILNDAHIAEDLAQEVFLDIWKKRDQFQINTSLKAYLRRAGINRTLNYIRDRKLRWDDEDKIAHLHSDPSSDANRQLESQELKDKIDSVIDGLPERCRLVFTLSRYEELSYQEIAEQLGISIKTVENQMSKALKILRTAFDSEINGG